MSVCLYFSILSVLFCVARDWHDDTCVAVSEHSRSSFRQRECDVCAAAGPMASTQHQQIAGFERRAHAVSASQNRAQVQHHDRKRWETKFTWRVLCNAWLSQHITQVLDCVVAVLFQIKVVLSNFWWCHVLLQWFLSLHKSDKFPNQFSTLNRHFCLSLCVHICCLHYLHQYSISVYIVLMSIIGKMWFSSETRDVLNIRFVFTLVPNIGANSVFVFGQTVSSERIRIVSLYSAASDVNGRLQSVSASCSRSDFKGTSNIT